MGLREEQRELTRHKVVTAVLELVAEGTLDDLSMPSVARRSGVSVATIYRYFPTKDELLAAAAAEPSRLALASVDRPPHRDGDDEFGDHLRAMWQQFSENLPLLRHQLASEAGRGMRSARLTESRAQLANYVERFGVEPTSADGERLISMIMLVAGSVALVELHDRQGLDVDESVEHALWAVRSLIEASGGRPPAEASS